MGNPDIAAYYGIHTSWRGFLTDDATLVYLSDADGMAQVYRMDRKTGETRQLTRLPSPVGNLTPDWPGQRLFFTGDQEGNEQEQIFSLDLRTEEISRVTNDPKGRFAFGGVLPGGGEIIAISTARNGRNFDVVKVDLATGNTAMLLETDSGYNQPLGLSPDGRYFLYVAGTSSWNKPLWLLDIQTGEARQLHPEGGEAQYRDICWTADASGFYLITDAGSDFLYAAYYDLASGMLTRIHEEAWDADGLALSSDGRYLAMLFNEEGYGTLKVLDLSQGILLNTPMPPRACAFSHLGFSFQEGTHRLVFSMRGIRQPGNVWLLDMDADRLERLTSVKWTELTPADLTEPVLRRFTSFDGLVVPYWMYRRADTPLGAPVLLDIHGGPEGQALPIYAPFTQYLVRQGFVVVAPNVRGSTGYGKRYHHLDDVEKRLDSIRDVKALVGHLITEGIARPDGIGIMGGSYGGFMTLLGITEYPEAFSAAVDFVGMSNLETFLENTAPYRRAQRESEYGTLAHDRDTLRRVSPIHRMDRVRTPLMVIHGANDPRVPLSEAEQLVESLRARGVTVQYLVYADEGHGLSRLENKLDCYPKVADFLKRHLMRR